MYSWQSCVASYFLISNFRNISVELRLVRFNRPVDSEQSLLFSPRSFSERGSVGRAENAISPRSPYALYAITLATRSWGKRKDCSQSNRPSKVAVFSIWHGTSKCGVVHKPTQASTSLVHILKSFCKTNSLPSPTKTKLSEKNHVSRRVIASAVWMSKKQSNKAGSPLVIHPENKNKTVY